jgi:hypothetical protein
MRFNNNQFTSLNESIFRLNEWAPPSRMPWELDPSKYSPVDGGPTHTDTDDDGGFEDEDGNIVDGPEEIPPGSGIFYWNGRRVYFGNDGNWWYIDDYPAGMGPYIG